MYINSKLYLTLTFVKLTPFKYEYIYVIYMMLKLITCVLTVLKLISMYVCKYMFCYMYIAIFKEHQVMMMG